MSVYLAIGDICGQRPIRSIRLGQTPGGHEHWVKFPVYLHDCALKDFSTKSSISSNTTRHKFLHFEGTRGCLAPGAGKKVKPGWELQLTHWPTVWSASLLRTLSLLSPSRHFSGFSVFWLLAGSLLAVHSHFSRSFHTIFPEFSPLPCTYHNHHTKKRSVCSALFY